MTNHDPWTEERTVAHRHALMRGLFAIGILGAPIVLLGFITKPVWVPSYMEAHRGTPAEELRRAEYYDEQGGGWVGFFNRSEADRRAKESYEWIIRFAPQSLSAWQAHDNLAQMNYDEGNFKQAIEHWNEARSLSDSSWRRTSIEEKIERANCRIAGGSQNKCLGLE